MAPKEKGTAPGGASMLVLALLKDQEMYGYQIIEELEKRSNNVFQMKEGTLYPLLHSMEKEGLVTGREGQSPAGRTRRYYRITSSGRRELEERERAWHVYASAVSAVLAGA